MSGNESTVRIRTQAEISQLVAYAQALAKVNDELAKTAALRQKVAPGGPSGGGGGGGSNGATGDPPPVPPPATPAAAPPPVPPPAPSAAPPAPATPAAITDVGGWNPSGMGAPGASWSPGGGSVPPAPEDDRKDERRPPPERQGFVQRGAQNLYASGRSFLSTAAGTAMGVGLGTSIMGLPMAAINQYMTLSTVLSQVHARFRDASDGADMFGTKMGYSISRSAQLADALGAATNTFSKEEGVRYAGFARYTGMDAEAAMRTLGSVRQLSGRELTNTDLAQLLGIARESNMDQGRLEEFLQRISQQTKEQFAATGQMDWRSAAQVADLPSMIYGKGTVGAANDESLVGGLHSTLTSGGAMQSYMMRAMGYGRKGGPDYMQMRERLEAGVYDPRNLIDLFQSFEDRGMGQGAQFRAIESVAGGSLKAHQIRKLVERMGSGGLDELKRQMMMSESDTGMAEFFGSMSAEEFSTWAEEGFGSTEKFTDRQGRTRERGAGLGTEHISAGEAYSNRIESTMMNVGGMLAQSIPNIQDTIESIGRTLMKIFDGDLGGTLERLTGAIERGALFLEDHTGSWREGAFMRDVPGAAGVARNIGRLKARYDDEGVLGSARELLEINLEGYTGQEFQLSDFDLSRGGSGTR